MIKLQLFAHVELDQHQDKAAEGSRRIRDGSGSGHDLPAWYCIRADSSNVLMTPENRSDCVKYYSRVARISPGRPG